MDTPFIHSFDEDTLGTAICRIKCWGLLGEEDVVDFM